MDVCKLLRSKTGHNTTFTRLKHARPSTKSRDIIGALSGGSYTGNVTVHRYNGHITDINLHARPSDIYECTLAMLCIKLCKLNQAAKRLFVTGKSAGKRSLHIHVGTLSLYVHMTCIGTGDRIKCTCIVILIFIVQV